jgi:hypothetical protein
MVVSLDHDRPYGDGAEERDPTACEADQAPEGVVREPRIAAGDGIGTAELGMREGKQHHRAAAEQPRDDRRRPGER